MEINSENGSNSLDEPEQGESISAATPLLDVLALIKKKNFQSTIPDAVTEKLLQASGCATTDPKMTKIISLAAQTFMSAVANDALQHYKIRGAPQSNKLKGKDGKDEPRNTLHMEDLITSVEDRGIVVKKPPYFV